MRIVVGASGRTGLLIVEQLIAKKHAVVGTIRNPKHMVELVKRGAEVALIDLDTSEFESTSRPDPEREAWGCVSRAVLRRAPLRATSS